MFTLVIGIAFLPFRLPDYIGYIIHAVLYTEKQIALTIFDISHHAFPHLFWINVFLILGPGMYVFSIFTERYVVRYFSRFWLVYLGPDFNIKDKTLAFTMLTGVLIISLAIEECGLRLAGCHSPPYHSLYHVEETGWLHTYYPDQSFEYTTQEFTQKGVCNSLGFVDREWNKQKTDSLRIACFGDSFTQGVGAVGDSCYPRLLQSLMPPGTDVLNFGISGSDPLFGYMALKTVGVGYHPDIVTLTVNASDIRDVMIRGGMERFSRDGTTVYRRQPWWTCIYDRSAVCRMLDAV